MIRMIRRWSLILLALMLFCSAAAAEGELRGYSEGDGYIYVTFGQYFQSIDGGIPDDGKQAWQWSVQVKTERKAATEFRNFLLDNGFSMVQYSIYTKLFSGKDACEKYYKLIGRNLPSEGKVDIITITDKQYENIISYTAAEKTPKKRQEQLLLF